MNPNFKGDKPKYKDTYKANLVEGDFHVDMVTDDSLLMPEDFVLSLAPSESPFLGFSRDPTSDH